MPLCAECHRLLPDSYHRIDGGKRGFEARYGLNLARLVEQLNATWQAMRL